VARNRKRAKERRARRTDGGNGSRPPRAGRPEPAQDPFDPSDPFESGDTLEAPSPIEHASADAELAEEAIAFGDSQPAVDDGEARVEQKRLEEEFEEERRERVATAAPAVTGRRPSLFARLVGFLQGSWRELQRVQWPDRRQVAQATGVVLGFVIVAGVFLGLCDLAFSHLMNYILK
jgi:preprotein translocase subunit SecE